MTKTKLLGLIGAIIRLSPQPKISILDTAEWTCNCNCHNREKTEPILLNFTLDSVGPQQRSEKNNL